MRSLSRRELLISALGASAAAGCRSQPLHRAVEGGIAGADDSLGHKLRDGFDPPPTRERRVPVVIVGGGVAGLSAAWRLLRAGVSDFEVLELDDAPGGTARAGHNDI